PDPARPCSPGLGSRAYEHEPHALPYGPEPRSPEPRALAYSPEPQTLTYTANADAGAGSLPTPAAHLARARTPDEIELAAASAPDLCLQRIVTAPVGGGGGAAGAVRRSNKLARMGFTPGVGEKIGAGASAERERERKWAGIRGWVASLRGRA
ncbi:hypothetical protein K488DRAFT_92435, partial [Vararia minispora EC-137]